MVDGPERVVFGATPPRPTGDRWLRHAEYLNGLTPPHPVMRSVMPGDFWAWCDVHETADDLGLSYSPR